MPKASRISATPPHPVRKGVAGINVGRYRQALRLPGAAAFYFSALPVRVASAMLPIALVVFIHAETGSFAISGIVVGVVSVAAAVSGPLSGKLIDLFGQRRVLLPRLIIHSGSLVCLTLGVMAGAPHGTTYALALFAGATVPQTGSLIRARWSHALGGTNLLPTALSLESLTDDVTFLIGPAMATLLAAAFGPAVPLFVLAALILIGGLTFLAGRRTEPPANAHSAGIAQGLLAKGAMSVKGMPLLAVSFVGLGAVFGAMQVSVIAFAEHSGVPAAAGALYGVFAAASIVSGFGYGLIAWRSAAVTRLALAFFVLSLGCLAMVPVSDLSLMWLLVALPGLAISPAMITSSVLIESVVPKPVLTEAYTWLSSMTGLGIALGSSLSGRVVQTVSPQDGFAVGAAAAAGSCALILFSRTRIRTPEMAAPSTKGTQ